MSDNNNSDNINASDNNNNNDSYEEICYICRRPESKAGKMIHIPNNICICNDCMQKTFDSMNNMNLNGISKYALYGYVRIWYAKYAGR